MAPPNPLEQVLDTIGVPAEAEHRRAWAQAWEAEAEAAIALMKPMVDRERGMRIAAGESGRADVARDRDALRKASQGVFQGLLALAGSSARPAPPHQPHPRHSREQVVADGLKLPEGHRGYLVAEEALGAVLNNPWTYRDKASGGGVMRAAHARARRPFPFSLCVGGRHLTFDPPHSFSTKRLVAAAQVPQNHGEGHEPQPGEERELPPVGAGMAYAGGAIRASDCGSDQIGRFIEESYAARSSLRSIDAYAFPRSFAVDSTSIET